MRTAGASSNSTHAVPENQSPQRRNGSRPFRRLSNEPLRNSGFGLCSIGHHESRVVDGRINNSTLHAEAQINQCSLVRNTHRRLSISASRRNTHHRCVGRRLEITAQHSEPTEPPHSVLGWSCPRRQASTAILGLPSRVHRGRPNHGIKIAEALRAFFDRRSS